MDCRVMSIREKQWMDIITACNASNMNKKEWMKIHNISPKNFYRWQKVLRERALTRMEEEGTPALLPCAGAVSELAAEEEGPGFVDMTAMVSHEAEAVHMQIVPELMLEVGSYHLFVGSGITETTLSTVLKAIRNA